MFCACWVDQSYGKSFEFTTNIEWTLKCFVFAGLIKIMLNRLFEFTNKFNIEQTLKKFLFARLMVNHSNSPANIEQTPENLNYIIYFT